MIRVKSETINNMFYELRAEITDLTFNDDYYYGKLDKRIEKYLNVEKRIDDILTEIGCLECKKDEACKRYDSYRIKDRIKNM